MQYTHSYVQIMYSDLTQLCLIPLLDIFLVGESDSDFIFTIWHKGNPHSGVNVHISGNGI